MPNHAFKMVSLVSALTLATSGCVASHTWAPGPHQSASNFTEVSGHCKLVAMGADTGQSLAYAQGSPQFVGSYLGAITIAGAVDSHNRQQNAMNACMEANGFVEADNLSTANPRVAQVAEIMAQVKACGQSVKDKPTYASLRPHFIEEGGRYTSAQLADTTVPTPAESELLLGYIDEQRVCADRYLPKITNVSPIVGQVFSQVSAEIKATQSLLVNRLLSWGEAARRNQTTLDTASENLRTQGV